MLIEIHKVRQRPGEAWRRWFTDERMDLLVWADEEGRIVAFQLCYDKQTAERALSWKPSVGFLHDRVDDGERPGKHKATPILLADGRFDLARVLAEFRERAAEIDPTVAAFIAARIAAYPR